MPLMVEPGIIPRLNCYRGPDGSINGFMRGRPVRHLSVPSPRAQLLDQGLLDVLREIEQPERIVSLDLRRHNLTSDFLREVCEQFPNLRALALWAEEYDPAEEGSRCNFAILYAALCSPEPCLQRLELLSISLDNEYEILEPEDVAGMGMDINLPPTASAAPKGRYLASTFEDEPPDASRLSKDYTIGPDGTTGT
ncbi:hypothetical protein C8F04DRAFT_1113000 [Mycena alexandri]|uniref:Uncharacterized protein n=1 Tax=Mycena alexandri TaxID=1745969 RepID=A0AAD6SQF8_9AGAR|nr:hypothetical protein C8F04DRAFT_1113000 [Mycena alexandri]